MKLSKRLKHIEALVTPGYTHIWDCCCDHGLLGSALLSRLAAPYIHFVDIAPELIRELECKLQQFYPTSLASWQTHCFDVALLPIGQYKGKSLVIIAGVGGDLVTQLVKAIHQSYPATTIDFLLCPIRHHYTLRQQLIKLDFSLKNEVLVEDNQRFYEILLVSSSATSDNKKSQISPVGELIWQVTTPEQAEITANYLQKTLDHLKRMQRGNKPGIQHIIDAYRAVKIRYLPV